MSIVLLLASTEPGPARLLSLAGVDKLIMALYFRAVGNYL